MDTKESLSIKVHFRHTETGEVLRESTPLKWL